VDDESNGHSNHKLHAEREKKLLEPGAKIGHFVIDAARTRQAIDSMSKHTVDLQRPARHFPAPGGGVKFEALVDALRAAEEMSEHSQLASLSMTEFAIFLSVVAKVCLSSKHRIEAAEAMIQDDPEGLTTQSGGLGLSDLANDGARLRFLLLHIAGPHYVEQFGHPLRGRPL